MANSRKPRSAEAAACPLDEVVAAAVARDTKPGEIITVGLSGGVDSIVLLDILRRIAPHLGVGVRALHVNHGISPNAARWQRFCADHCRRRGIEFKAVKVQMAGRGSNLEAEARRARYGAFVQHGCAVIALAHHLDDQAETVLLHLLRGAGVRGLAAMPALRRVGPLREGGANAAMQQRLLRPLLHTTRDAILQHALRRKLRWVDDESNRNPRFARNYLRLHVLPMLERRFPGCKVNLSRAASHMQEAAAVLDEIGMLDCAFDGATSRLSVAALRRHTPARAVNAMRTFLAVCGEPPPSTARTAELLRQLTGSRPDACPEVVLSQGIVGRFRNWLEWRPRAPADVSRDWGQWHGEAKFLLGDEGALIAVKARGRGVSATRLRQAPVTVRRRRGGERIRLHADRPTRTLKNLLQEAAIPPWQRERLPLVFCGEQLVWVPRVGVASAFQARAGEVAWRFAWWTPAENQGGP